MKISKKSWHYWLNSIFNKRLNYLCGGSDVTLCEYFWGTCKSILIGLLCAVAAVGLLGVLVVGLFSIINALAFLSTAITGVCFDWVYGEFCFELVMLLSILALIGGVVAWLGNDINFFPEYMKKPFRKTEPSSRKESKPSLVVEMYKAHKSKWCPLIKIED